MYLMSITAARARSTCRRRTSCPTTSPSSALVDGARRGVRVRIIVPGPHIDKAIVRRASRATWGELLAAGVEIHEYQPTMFHCKVMVVDGLWVSVGSTNFDSRSFSINDEANLNVYDAAFARARSEVFEDDLRRPSREPRTMASRRSWWDKSLDAAAALLSAQL